MVFYCANVCFLPKADITFAFGVSQGSRRRTTTDQGVELRSVQVEANAPWRGYKNVYSLVMAFWPIPQFPAQSQI